MSVSDTPDNSMAPGNAIDLVELKEIMDDDMELIHECFSDFVADWPLLYVQIKTAVMQKDSQDLEEISHKLKGILKYLAAKKAAQAADILEAAGQNSNFNKIETKLETLKNECQNVIGYIKEFKK